MSPVTRNQIPWQPHLATSTRALEAIQALGSRGGAVDFNTSRRTQSHFIAVHRTKRVLETGTATELKPEIEKSSYRTRHQRSEEHTSELQSHLNLVCRLLLEKKKKPTSPPSKT